MDQLRIKDLEVYAYPVSYTHLDVYKRQELSRSHFEKVEQNKLYVKQDGKSIAFGKSKSDDFRKTDANGRGYQPMIYGLEAAQIHKEGQIVHLHLQFKDGLEREYIYRVEEEH